LIAVAAAVAVGLVVAGYYSGRTSLALEELAGDKASSCAYVPVVSAATPASSRANATCWNRDVALWCADAVGRAYASVCSPDGRLSADPAPPGTTTLALLWNRQHKGVFGTDKRAIGYVAGDATDCSTRYVVLRGTVGNLEWIDDLDVDQTKMVLESRGPGATALVHKGFYDILTMPGRDGTLSLFAQIRRALIPRLDVATPADSWPAVRQVFVCGHSLGAGLAQQCAVMIKALPEYSGVTVRVYTYGNPRTGDVAFATRLNDTRVFAEVFNHMNTADVIPQHPVGIDTLVKPTRIYQQGGRVIAFADERGTLGDNHVIQHYRESLSTLKSMCPPRESA